MSAPSKPVAVERAVAVASASTGRTAGSTRLFAGLAAAGLVLVGIALAVWYWTSVPQASEVAEALAKRRFDETIQLAHRRLQRYPHESSTRLVLGEAYQRQSRLEEAVATYDTIPISAGPDALAARLASASILIREGRLADTERALEAAATIDPDNSYGDELQANVRTLTGQRWLSLPVLHRILARGRPSLSHLIYLANPDEMPAPPDDVFANMLKVGDALGLLGAAHAAGAIGRYEQAYELIDRSLEQQPELVEAHLLKGTLLLHEGKFTEFDRYGHELPPAARAHPVYWFNLGQSAHQHGDNRGAVRCYWETLRLQPNHDRAMYQIGQVLAAEGRREVAQRFLDRGQKLSQLVNLSVEIFDGRQDDYRFWECAQLTRALGRLPEAGAWCKLLLERNPRHAGARQMLATLLREWDHPPPPLLPDHDLTAHFAGDAYPLPKLSSPQPATPEVAVVAGQIHFEDEAAKAGLHFVYFSGDDPQTPGKRMFEYTGGGVAVLDYDRDGWPDVFFTQGSSYPGDLAQREYCDALWRNRHGQDFGDVSLAADVVDYGFGQGAAVGDFDNDGFPDLYIANIDGNRLLQNQGDGTFQDISALTGLGHKFWTTSCLLADFNDDGIVDVYDVTFLVGEDIFDKMCRGNDGHLRSCAPASFDAAPDQVYLGRGDGTFEKLKAEAGFDVPDGDGLGIVAADFDGSGKVSLFVGNDGRANFLFVPEAVSGPFQRWNEVGILSGVAFDEAGMAQATMGIAASDANNDGLIDMFTTNFYQESNAYYLNLGSLAFSDRARSTGLRDPSLEMLGFGTQFLDADCNGWDDLLVVNGHVDDFTHKQFPYKMPPQFFENIGGRFREGDPKSLGPFFETLRLGRGLATLDWNRDGLVDAAVSQIGDPAALVTNRSRDCGQWVSLRLVGRNRSRDAIGTRVAVEFEGKIRERQLTAGDGYQASNERRLHFGLGHLKDDAVVQLEIHWPGGVSQRFENVAIGREYLAIEGLDRLWDVPR